MREYILLNKDKSIRTFKWTSIILTIAFISISYSNTGSWYKKAQFLYGLAMTLLILPTFSIVFEIIPGFIEYKRTEKFFGTEPVNGLLKNGFRKDLTNKSSKWLLSKLRIAGHIEEYEVICEIENGRLGVIAKTNYDHLDTWTDEEIESIQQSFRHVKFEYDGDGIATSLKVDDVKKMTYEGLVGYLGEFVRVLRELKIK